MQLTLREVLKPFTLRHVELLQGGQLPEAYHISKIRRKNESCHSQTLHYH